MTWSAPMTAVDTAIFTASQYNQYIRDNFFETAVAKAGSAGEMFFGSGTNQVSPRKPGVDFIDTGESVSSDTYTDLTTPGPTVTVETGTRAIVMVQAGMQPTETSNTYQEMSYQVSGATSYGAADAKGMILDGISTGGGNIRYGAVHFEDDLTPGTNVFQAKYKSAAGAATCIFYYRCLVVVPL